MHPYINTAIKAVRTASQIILRFYDNHNNNYSSIKEKYYVSLAEKEVEQCIVNTLHEAYPQHNFVTKEYSDLKYGDSNEITWIIDPLSSVNFIHRLPYFAIAIAARKQGKLQHAVIYHPITDELFTASRGGGAQLNGNRIRVTSTTKLEETLLSLSIPHNSDDLDHYCRCVKQLGIVAEIRCSGTIALDLAYLAAGRLDGLCFYEQELQDIAAGVLLIREAGGIVTNIHGSDNIFAGGSLVAANSKLIRLMLKLLRNNTIFD